MKLEDLLNIISSRESADGHSRSGWLRGQMIQDLKDDHTAIVRERDALKAALEFFNNAYIVGSSGSALKTAVVTHSKRDADTLAELIKSLGQVANVREQKLSRILEHYPEFVRPLAALRDKGEQA